jgi:hypothetical protein
VSIWSLVPSCGAGPQDGKSGLLSASAVIDSAIGFAAKAIASTEIEIVAL